jgi:hypothetical protein
MEEFSELYKSRTISCDLFDALLGKKIGSGAGRQVYEHRLDPTLVVKIETSGGSFQNIMEAQLWSEVSQMKKYSKWFAPVKFISACGTVLIIKKAQPARKNEYPEKIPAFLTDRKYQNFGMLKGHLVCIDYGSVILTKGFTKKIEKAHWWGDENEDVQK